MRKVESEHFNSFLPVAFTVLVGIAFGLTAITNNKFIIPIILGACVIGGIILLIYIEDNHSQHMTYESNPIHDAWEMKEYLEKMVQRQKHETKTVLEWAQEKGALTGITWEDVVEYNRGISWLCNEHVFRSLKSKGLMTDRDYYDFYVTHFYLQRRQVAQLHDFLAPADMIKLIRRAGGIPILAHPHGQLDRVEELISYGLLGIEVYHPDMLPEEQRQALDIAYEKGLFISGGTDHSGLCGGMYSSFDEPEESTYYLEPQSHGTLEEHFRELQNRSLSARKTIPQYITSHKHYR
jgi:predicted metal-dependent phosphoesterase TrpH